METAQEEFSGKAVILMYKGLEIICSNNFIVSESPLLCMLMLCSCRYPGTTSEVTEVVDEIVVGGDDASSENETNPIASENDGNENSIT